MTVSTGTLQTLKENHPTSSWAIWSPTFPDQGCVEEDEEQLVEYIQNNRHDLRPSVVLLSLNPSTDMPSNFSNFHSIETKHRNDQFRDVVAGSGLEGAYMADLVERTVEADSSNVEPNAKDIENLFSQLELLDEEDFHLICFHQKVFDTLVDDFVTRTRELEHNISAFTAHERGLTLHGFRVWFHANWGVHKDKMDELEDQLAFLGDLTNNPRDHGLSNWINP